MSIIYIGSAVDRELLKTLPDASVAGNKMQLGFIKGLKEKGIDTTVLSVEPHGMWKMNKKPIFIKNRTLHDENLTIHTLGYINIPGFKQLMIEKKYEYCLERMLRSNKYKDSVMVVYNTMSIFAKPVLKMANKYNLKAVAIIADLPIQEKKNWFRRYEDKMQIKAIGKFSALIPLTELIAADFAPGIPYCVIEAGCNVVDYPSEQEKLYLSKEKKTIVFSGTLNSLSGIELLLNAMEYINDECINLEIYGDGPLRNYVVSKTKVQRNTHYKGCVSNDKMIQIQMAADLLVCPRKKDSFMTKYSFPSKVLEYICSGTPVLANRLVGIPSEYDELINYPEDESALAWSKAIIEILCDSKYNQYQKKALNAKKIVFAEKTWKKQVEKVVNFLQKNEIL